MAYAGTHQALEYDMEDTYAVTNTTFEGGRFGCGIALSTASRNNNIERVAGLGEKIACKLVEKQFIGTWAIDFLLTDVTWMTDIVLKSTAGTQYEVTTDLQSFQMRNYFGMNDDGTTSDAYIDMLGCILGDWSITAAVNDVVKCNLSGMYADETLAIASAAQDDTTHDFDAVTFAKGSVTTEGLTIANVQSFTLSGRTNAEQIFGLGSRISSDAVRKLQEIDVNIECIFDATAGTGPRALLGLLYTGTSDGVAPGETVTTAAGDLVLRFTDYSGTNDFTYTLQDFKFNTGNIPQSVNEVVKFSLSGMAEKIIFDTNG
jgi:hypothetical protein